MNISVQNSVNGQFKNISEYLRINAEKFPGKPALLHPVRMTYLELELEVDRYSFGLENAGIKSGSLAILMVPAGAEFFIITFALLRIGAIPVMIDPGMGINAMSKALSDIKADAFIGIAKAHLLKFFRPSLFATVKSKIIIGFPWFPGGRRLKNILDSKDKKYPVFPVHEHHTAAIFFTSGSTGPAKGVVYTSGMLINQIEITKSQFKLGSDETDLCTFPLLGLFAICHGNSSVIADMNMMRPARLNPERLMKNIKDFSCTQMFGSPMVLNKLSEYGLVNRIKLPSLRHIISAGAPVHRHVLESFIHLVADNATIHIPYGATEALPVTDIEASERLLNGLDEEEQATGIYIGYPVNGLDVRVIGISDDQILSWHDSLQNGANEVGEIVVKGPWVTTEYFNNPEANRVSKIYDPSGGIWHRMGDLARIDDLGRLWFYGRKSQRVVTSDATMFTIPCEAVFNRHPEVSRSALVGIGRNNEGLSRPVICIQLKKGSHPTRKIIRELLELASGSSLTKGISDVLFIKKKFPVDPRHNAKIFREKLAKLANKKVK